MDLRSGECNVVSLYVCVALSMDLFVLCVVGLTVFVNCFVKQFAICFCVFVVECDEVVECGWKYSIGYTMHGLPYHVCVVPVVPVSL